MHANEHLYLGIDVGSVSTNLVLIDEAAKVKEKAYLRTGGRPLVSMQQGLALIRKAAGSRPISGAATTGSARRLVGAAVGADLVKNEITAHAVAALHCLPEVRTVMEIGGQDSKVIIIRDGVVVDFAMNTICAAGTGSFLDQQAARLNLNLEEFGRLALTAAHPVAIAGRCAVFAESDMIHKQQIGHSLSDIAGGLCAALVRNFLNNVAKGQEIAGPVVFQGGVAANLGMRRAFAEALGEEPFIPEHFAVMGALGAALLVREQMRATGWPSTFAGWNLCEEELETAGRICHDCSNQCELVALYRAGRLIAYLGDRCGKWSETTEPVEADANTEEVV